MTSTGTDNKQTDELRAELEEVQRAYQDFKKRVDTLSSKEHALMKDVQSLLNNTKVDDIMQQLKSL